MSITVSEQVDAQATAATDEVAERLASDLSAEVQRKYSRYFESLPVDIYGLAKELCMSLHYNKSTGLRAYVEWESDRGGGDVWVQQDLSPERRRLAIAHELSHVFLATNLVHPPIAWPHRQEEAFANYMARELLIPIGKRDSLRRTLRDASGPDDLIAMAKDLKVAPSVCLRFATEHTSWLSNSMGIWLFVGARVNRYTGLDMKLRILRSYCDPCLFFLPWNVGIDRVIAPFHDLVDIEGLDYGDLFTGSSTSVQVQRVDQVSMPKYKWVTMISDMTGVMLKGTSQPYFIIYLRNLRAVESLE